MPRLSEEQILQARSVDLLDYLKTFEPTNVRKSKGSHNEYYMVEHDSLKISNGKWFRHSTQQGGYSALDFLIKIRGVHFVDAVQSLTSSNIIQNNVITQKTAAPLQSLPNKPFILPKPNKNNDIVIAYLRGRGIDKVIINDCIKAGILYESYNHRCIFVGIDERRNARYACERGTSDEIKKDVTGSSKRFGFFLPPKEQNGHKGNVLTLFESPVDVLAHATIHKIGQTEMDGFRLSLGGVSSSALNGFLEWHSNISDIRIALDNDKAGKDATNRIIKELLSDKRYSHIKVSVIPPPIGKDYADTLKAINQNNISKSTIDRPKEAVY